MGGTLGPSPKSATLAVTIIPVSPTGGVATPGIEIVRLDAVFACIDRLQRNARAFWFAFTPDVS